MTTQPTTAIEAPAPAAPPLIPTSVIARPYRFEAVADLLPGHHILLGDPLVEAVVVAVTKTSTGWEIATTKDGAVGGRRAIRRLELADGETHADVMVGRLADIDDLAAIRTTFLAHDAGKIRLDQAPDDGKLYVYLDTTLGQWIVTV